MDFAMRLQKSGHNTGHRAGQRTGQQPGERMRRRAQHGRDRHAERERAVDREVGQVQDAERDVHADREQRVFKTEQRRVQKEVHGLSLPFFAASQPPSGSVMLSASAAALLQTY